MKKLLYLFFFIPFIGLLSCKTAYHLPSFSSQRWHVDSYSGNAVSTSGLEFGFGSEWMLTDTTLIQTPEQMNEYSKLEPYLAKALSEFKEITVDSIYFYNPHRGLLFVEYHQEKPLMPTSEIMLCKDLSGVYSPEFTRLFGIQVPYDKEDGGWESGGPSKSVYSNVRFKPKKKELILLQRIPYRGKNIAVLQIHKTNEKKGKWWEEYPRGTFSSTDFGDLNNIGTISHILQSSRTCAVVNLTLGSVDSIHEKASATHP